MSTRGSDAVARSAFERGSLRWVLQRATAVFLIGTLAFHFYLLHFVNHAADITLAGTTARMGELGYLLTMVAFLFAATVHGVNGVYNALVNAGLSGTRARVVKWGLIVASIALLVQGLRVAAAMSPLINL
ncbi:succinate dehydrogenase [Halococcoides cellulosivorans]|uniref:Succinate dehydrogenase n=1 Tax=Halococcoides cellulosivorans TaxID=1679096 RepID=A0A2R4X351_9EURY|nr:succinate dehydrogenase [Halococcoides cellulosivorans]AWB28113.1 succinate dehydrogenase [Halococcoides cellulosivorans]